MTILTSLDGQTGLPRYFASVFEQARQMQHGRLDVTLPDGRVFRVEGTWDAAVQQACVVTLEPVAESLAGSVEASFEVGTRPADAGGEVLVDPDGADPADMLPEEGIDLGELVVQELAVALDPYRRAPGAEVPPQYQPSEVEKNEGPFAALKVLKGER